MEINISPSPSWEIRTVLVRQVGVYWLVLLLSNQLYVRSSVGRPYILKSHVTILRESSGHQLKTD